MLNLASMHKPDIQFDLFVCVTQQQKMQFPQSTPSRIMNIAQSQFCDV